MKENLVEKRGFASENLYVLLEQRLHHALTTYGIRVFVSRFQVIDEFITKYNS